MTLIPTWNPPAIISPRRLTLSAHVRAAVEQLRPDVVCLPDVGMGELVTGIESRRVVPTGTVVDVRRGPVAVAAALDAAAIVLPRLIVSESDPALRATWTAAQNRQVQSAPPLDLECAAYLARERGSNCLRSTDGWSCLCSAEVDWKVADRYGHAAWAIAVAAGAGAWSRDANGRFNAPLRDGELTERIFPAWFMSEIKPGEGFTCVPDLATVVRDWRTRAETADAWAREHVARICETGQDLILNAIALSNPRHNTSILLVLDSHVASKDISDLLKFRVHVLAFCTDTTIDDWVLPDGETVQRGPRAPRWGGGLTWTRLDSGDWVGRSFK